MRNYKTHLNLWLVAQFLYYFGIGFGLYFGSAYLPNHFLAGYLVVMVLALCLCTYAVRMDSEHSRRRSYFGLLNYRSSCLTFFFWTVLCMFTSTIELLLGYCGAIAGIIFFVIAREILMLTSRWVFRKFPADLVSDK